MLKNPIVVFILVLILSVTLSAEDNPGRVFDFMKLSDEVSFYQNTEDNFDGLGRTLQIVAINQVKIGTWIQVEFTGDFNWDMTPGQDYDYYVEVGVVKPVWKYFSVNYQRIYGTYVDKPINQWGVRFSL